MSGVNLEVKVEGPILDAIMGRLNRADARNIQLQKQLDELYRHLGLPLPVHADAQAESEETGEPGGEAKTE